MQLTGRRGKAGLTAYPLIASATPLHYAAMLSLPDLCKRLISSGCSVQDSSVFGRPLHCAIFGDRAPWAALEHPFKTDTETSRLPASTINVIELLLDAGADINDPIPSLE
jgi:ankyrin repeat protein